MTKYNKAYPLYYRITPINADGSETVTPKDCATFIGCENYLRSNDLTKGRINSVQKIGGRIEIVTGKAKAIINDLIIEV